MKTALFCLKYSDKVVTASVKKCFKIQITVRNGLDLTAYFIQIGLQSRKVRKSQLEDYLLLNHMTRMIFISNRMEMHSMVVLSY